jgi:hypothetical protein
MHAGIRARGEITPVARRGWAGLGKERPSGDARRIPADPAIAWLPLTNTYRHCKQSNICLKRLIHGWVIISNEANN